MSVSSETLNSFLAGWEALKKQRPSEHDFAPFGFPNLTYEHLDQIFARWDAAFAALEQKGTWITSPEAALADRPIANMLTDLTGLVNAGVHNGVNWMAASGFVQKVLDIQTQVTSLSARRISASREVAKLLVKKGHDELERILAAERAAKEISSLGQQLTGDAEAAQRDASEIAVALENTKSLSEELAVLQEAIETSASTAEENHEKIKAALSAALELQATAEERDNKLRQHIEDTDEKLQIMQNMADEGFESVTKALRAARDQGLAGAFQSRSNKLRSERRIWTIVFVGAIAILAALAIVFAVNFEKFTYEVLIVSILRKFALAAPAVWIGWYSAKQIGRVGRVQEDYEYKAASALAFQSYKDEVKFSGDAELLKQLLGTAIATFGENPVRLYADAHGETVSPLEDALKKLPPDKISEFVAALAKLKAA